MTAVSTFVTLLTGGGLALVGVLTGAVITQVSTAAIARENRREARRMALKTFQRDTLIALQDSAITLLESAFQDVIRSAARPDPPLVAGAALAERRSFRDKKAAFQVTSSQVLLSRRSENFAPATSTRPASPRRARVPKFLGTRGTRYAARHGSC
jgi:hypothetical protein